MGASCDLLQQTNAVSFCEERGILAMIAANRRAMDVS